MYQQNLAFTIISYWFQIDHHSERSAQIAAYTCYLLIEGQWLDDSHFLTESHIIFCCDKIKNKVEDQ